MKRRSFMQAAGTALLAYFGGSDRDLRAAAYDAFDERTRELAYALNLAGASPGQAGGAYLHRRTSRPNGGVACILARSLAAPVVGKAVLLEPDAEALKAGRCYVSVVSRDNPLLAVRADIILRSSG
jgi:hypothetical protein